MQGLVATTEVFHSGSGGGGRGLAEAMSVPFLGKVCVSKSSLSMQKWRDRRTVVSHFLIRASGSQPDHPARNLR